MCVCVCGGGGGGGGFKPTELPAGYRPFMNKSF